MELTYPTLGPKENHLQTCHKGWEMLVFPGKKNIIFSHPFRDISHSKFLSSPWWRDRNPSAFESPGDKPNRWSLLVSFRAELSGGSFTFDLHPENPRIPVTKEDIITTRFSTFLVENPNHQTFTCDWNPGLGKVDPSFTRPLYQQPSNQLGHCLTSFLDDENFPAILYLRVW